MAIALHALYPRQFDLRAIRDSLGSDDTWRLIDAHASLTAVEQAVLAQGSDFAQDRARFLMY